MDTHYIFSAILVLARRIDFDQLIKPICIPHWALRPYKNYKATIAGWGKEKNIWVSNLKETPVQIWSQEFCSGIMEQEWKNANKWHTVTKYCCSLRKRVKLKIIFRSNLCTGAIFKDHSYWRDGEFHLGDKDKGANKYGGPCKGDWGTSLMVKEKERYAFN